MTEDSQHQKSIDIDSHSVQLHHNITWKTSLQALFYKSVKIQQRSYCSNICQILSPLLCVAFTLVIKLIMEDIVNTKIEMTQYPRPFNMPIIYELLPLNISCKQLYFYDYETHDPNLNREDLQKFINSNLQRYCAQTASLQPQFQYRSTMNKDMIDLLKQSEKERFENGQDLKTPMPDGIIKFHEFRDDKINVTVGINDYRLSEYHRNNGVTKLLLSTDTIVASYLMTTQGMMSLIDKMTKTFLIKLQPKQVIFGSFMYMPFDGEDKSLINKSINIIGTSLYPLGLSLLLPIFLYVIVSEKQQKLIEIMRMNGLNVKYYWINMFVFNFMLSIITFAFFYIFGYFFLQLSFFRETSAVLMWLVFVGWAIAQIGITNLVQIFIDSGKSATIVGYLLSIFSCLVGEVIACFIYSSPMVMPVWLMLYPPFALCRVIYLMGMACATTGCVTDFNFINPEIVTGIVIMYCWFFIYLLSIWLNDRFQQQYGVAQQINWLKRAKAHFFSRRENQLNATSQNTEIQLSAATQPKIVNVDETVAKLKEQVLSMAITDRCLVIKQLKKKYGGTSSNEEYVALKPFNFALENQEIFGLLGPNGAGKTTLISVLTGMYPKSQGNAWINGHEVGSNKANRFIGVCPQFDLLWPTLSVYEHLKFYAILKGVPAAQIQEKIDESLRDVDLLSCKEKPSEELSGGMQRRLSIAISLVSNPCVVFLDEPSSGLDPSHRRKLWQILKTCKKKTSIIVTTHLMQEAEALCDRIGIIDKGQLRCIGRTLELKEKFGEGYRLFIHFTDLQLENNNKIVQYIQQQYNDSRAVFKIEKQEVLPCVRWLKGESNINWAVSQPSLYDVFMAFVE